MSFYKRLKFAKSGILRRFRSMLHNSAKKRLQKNSGLWEALTSYQSTDASCGCSFSDYLVLYNYVRKNKPKEILECSTGISTIVLAYALKENENETGVSGRITSVEESKEWFDLAVKKIPGDLKKYIEIIYSPKTEAVYEIYRGVKYTEIPKRHYDFVFIDGPTTAAPSDGAKTFDFDFIDIIKQSDWPVFAIVDCRLSTCYVLQKILGSKKVKFDTVRALGYIGPCTKDDLRTTDQIISGPAILE